MQALEYIGLSLSDKKSYLTKKYESLQRLIKNNKNSIAKYKKCGSNESVRYFEKALEKHRKQFDNVVNELNRLQSEEEA